MNAPQGEAPQAAVASSVTIWRNAGGLAPRWSVRVAVGEQESAVREALRLALQTDAELLAHFAPEREAAAGA